MNTRRIPHWTMMTDPQLLHQDPKLVIIERNRNSKISFLTKFVPSKIYSWPIVPGPLWAHRKGRFSQIIRKLVTYLPPSCEAWFLCPVPTAHLFLPISDSLFNWIHSCAYLSIPKNGNTSVFKLQCFMNSPSKQEDNSFVHIGIVSLKRCLKTVKHLSSEWVI